MFVCVWYPDHAQAMFRSTMVTGYPGPSSPPWLGELVIRSTITYRGGVEIDKSMVSEWAYVKELATMNTRGKGERSLLSCIQRENVVSDREKEVSIGKKIREKYDRCSSFLTGGLLCSFSKGWGVCTIKNPSIKAHGILDNSMWLLDQ